MKEYTKNLGKVVMTPKGAWSIEKEYEILDIVYDIITERAYISKQEVPLGVDLSDSRYWMPLNVSGYSDSNVIALNNFNEDGEIQSYTLEEAIKTIKDVGRKSGVILIFYNDNVNRLDITTGCWEIWQFNSVNVYDWENLDAWINIYYNYNKFVGWYAADNTLNKEIPNPDVGCYAFVGNIYNEAFVYRCDVKNQWTKTNQKAQHYIKVVFGDNIIIGENGNWWQNGVDTNIPVSVKGDNGLTPYLRWSINNQIEYSYDNVNWYGLSERFSINIKIKDYVRYVNELPNNVELGTVYGVGPTYAENDINQTNPIYRIYVHTFNGWIDNGIFKGFSAGVIQELGDSETEVMSQKANTKLFSQINNNKISYYHMSNNMIDGYIKASDGASILNDGISVHDKSYFRVEPNSTLVINSNYLSSIYEYDIHKTYLKADWYSLKEEYVVSDSTYYIRIGYRNAEGLNIENFDFTTFFYFNNYSNEIKKLKEKSVTAPNIEGKSTSKVILIEDGTIQDVSSRWTTIKYVIKGQSKLYVTSKHDDNKSAVAAFFDEKGNYLKESSIAASSYYSIRSYTVDIPNNAKYVICSSADIEPIVNIDKTEKLTQNINILRNNTISYNHKYEDLSNGYYYASNGTVIGEPNDGTTVVDNYYFKVVPNSQIRFNTSYLVAVYEYDKNKNYLGSSWFKERTFFNIKEDVCYIRIGYRDVDGLTKDSFNFNTYYYNNVAKDYSNLKSLPIGRLSQRFEYHYFMGDRANIIPPQSIHDLYIAKRLGFKSIEINAHETSDGVLIGLHGSGGTFSYEVTNLNGEYTYANIPIKSVTYKWILENIRYHSIVPKFRTKILTLEEIIKEAKRIGMYITLYMSNSDIHAKCVELLEKYQDIPSYGVYSRSQGGQLRELTKGIITHYSTSNTLEAIIEDCNNIESPYIHVISNEVLIKDGKLSYSDEQLANILSAVHNKNCYLACAACYLPEDINQRLWKLGFDYAGSGWSVNDFESGNILNTGYDLYAHNLTEWNTDGVINTYTLTLYDGNSITLNKQEYMFLAKGYLSLMFNGNLNIQFGKNNVLLKSDGTDIIDLSSYFLDEEPFMTIKSVGTTEMLMFNLKLSKC